MIWTKLSEKVPTVEEIGEKVLIYRILNPGQQSQSYSVHDTFMLKHCNKDETWWCKLPEKPQKEKHV